MADSHEEQITALTARLNELENESRRVLGALRWSSRVRKVLILGLLLFLIVFGVLYYRLYSNFMNDRLAKVRQLINDRPEEFSEPLTRQMLVLLQDQGPYVANVFRDQISADQERFSTALGAERELFSEHMIRDFEKKLNEAYDVVIQTHEQALQREFPELRDPVKMKLVHDNLQDVYERVGRRYHVDVMREHVKQVVSQIDNFPRIEPRQPNVPVPEQIATEMLELVRMMLINSEYYVTPEEMERLSAMEGQSEATGATSTAPASTEVPDDAAAPTTDDTSGESDGDSGGGNLQSGNDTPLEHPDPGSQSATGTGS
jgi:hypothetical protein